MVLAKSTVVGIQETHGTVEKMRLELAQYRLQWRIFVSASANPNSGGVILFFRKSAFPSDARFLLEAIVPGRVLKVTVRTGNAVGEVWNIHNFALSRDQVVRVVRLMRSSSEAVRKDPQNRSLMALGDWNFLAPGEHRTFLAAPTKKSAHSQDDDINGGPMRNLWLSAIGELLELQQDAPTHFVLGSLTCVRLDHI